MRFLFALVLLAAEVLTAAGQQTAAALQLGDVQVVGVRRYSVGDVTKLSGLTVGKPVAVADLATAAQRMADTGLFTSVKYRFAIANGRIRLTFDIEEAAWTMPV